MKASVARRSLTVGETAARFGLETHVLRHWEEMGLLTPERDESGYRRYGEREAVRIGLILCNKVAGMSLEQVRTVLDADAPDRHEALVGHIEQLDRRIAAIHRARAMTTHALECEEHDVAACPRFQGHLQEVLDGVAARFRATAPPEHVVPATDPLGPASLADRDSGLDAWTALGIGRSEDGAATGE
jgi:MerR family copper efflux transcriptional regulator